MDSDDALIMGRKTYEQVLSFGEWPYGRDPVVVLSRSSISFPSSVPDTVTHSSKPSKPKSFSKFHHVANGVEKNPVFEFIGKGQKCLWTGAVPDPDFFQTKGMQVIDYLFQLLI